MKRQSSRITASMSVAVSKSGSRSSGANEHGVKFDFFRRRESTGDAAAAAGMQSFEVRPMRKSMMTTASRPTHTPTSKAQPTHHSQNATFASRLAHSDWYHTLTAERIRVVFNGKPFAVLMIFALLVALFLPDLFVIAGVRHNIGKDVVLTMVMLLFAFELVGLTAVDAMYVGSFFWIMDIIGTFSMIFDISWAFGADFTTPRTADGSGAKKNLMLLRAARAARVGARAGRLSRVLRMLRLDWFYGIKDKEKISNRGFAVVISNQLANSVATRVACLTILLVMVIPQFDILSFPQNDYALQTWVQRLAIKYKSKSAEGFRQELKTMVEFFEDDNYGPYMACHGYTVDGENFVCEEHVYGWEPLLPEPARLGSALLVHSETFLVGFNMDGPIKFEAQLAMLNILFIIFAMVGSGLLLSSVVTELAVRPLERMLLTVRQIASTVFKFSKDVEDENEDEEEEEEIYDVEGTSEMELLEKVVQKLAVVAELHTKNDHLDRTDDMKEEDIGILSMMRGKNVAQQSGASNARSRGATAARRKMETPASALEDLGVSTEEYESLGFNVLALTKSQKTTVAIFTIANFHAPGDGFVRTQDENQRLKRFVQAVEKGYFDNPFHNFAHAVDVVHMLARLMRKTGSDEFFTELEQFALLIASVAHDLGHPGVNNGFLSETNDQLALQYNDRSPLENMHCAKLYNIVGEEDTNVFCKMSKEQFKEVRKVCIETILHTDMMSHQAIVKDLQMTYQMNSEVFQNSQNSDSKGQGEAAAEVEVFNQSDVKTIILNCMLHAADVSNPCRAWEVSHDWAMKVVEEFFDQGDKERDLGIPVQFLNDRYKLNKPNSQIGFIEFMIAPFIFAQIRLWSNLAEMGDQLVSNLASWEDLWIQEVSPQEDERQKVRSRIDKVNEGLEDAKNRTG